MQVVALQLELGQTVRPHQFQNLVDFVEIHDAEGVRRQEEPEDSAGF